MNSELIQKSLCKTFGIIFKKKVLRVHIDKDYDDIQSLGEYIHKPDGVLGRGYTFRVSGHPSLIVDIYFESNQAIKYRVPAEWSRSPVRTEYSELSKDNLSRLVAYIAHKYSPCEYEEPLSFEYLKI